MIVCTGLAAVAEEWELPGALDGERLVHVANCMCHRSVNKYSTKSSKSCSVM